FHRLGLVALHVEQEVVGRIRRQALPPLSEQAGPDHRQQQQRAQRQRQAYQLHHGQAAASRQRGQPKPPRAVQARLQAAQQPQQARARGSCDQRQHRQPAQHPGVQLHVPGGVHGQRDGGCQRRQVGQQGSSRQR